MSKAIPLASFFAMLFCASIAAAQPTPDRSWLDRNLSPEARARAAVAAMTLDEKLRLVFGYSDQALTDLITEFTTHDEEFARLWAERDVKVNGRGRKVMRHPDVGVIAVQFEVLMPMPTHIREASPQPKCGARSAPQMIYGRWSLRWFFRLP